MPSIITFMGKAQIRWAGHVTLMPDERIPQQLLYGELCQGKRSVSGQRKRFEDSLKVSLIDFSIDTQTWENLAADRPTRRSFIHSGAYVAEYNRTDAAGKNARRARAAIIQQTTPIHMCPTYGRGFHSRIGLISHLRTHPANFMKSWGCHGHLRLRRTNNNNNNNKCSTIKEPGLPVLKSSGLEIYFVKKIQ